MIGSVGADAFAARLRAALEQDSVDITQVKTAANEPTGVAMILVDDAGENRIVLAPGANFAVTPADIDAAAAMIAGARLLVVQLEIPLAAVRHAVVQAAAAGVAVLLNPAPAQALPDDIWSHITYLVPNEGEATLLSGIPVHDTASAAEAARVLRRRGARHVLITMGAQGVFIADADGERLLPAKPVAATDTTAAGDCFIGGLVAGLSESMLLDTAANLGIAAAAICVTRFGAQPSLPCRAEVESAFFF